MLQSPPVPRAGSWGQVPPCVPEAVLALSCVPLVSVGRVVLGVCCPALCHDCVLSAVRTWWGGNKRLMFSWARCSVCSFGRARPERTLAPSLPEGTGDSWGHGQEQPVGAEGQSLVPGVPRTDWLGSAASSSTGTSSECPMAHCILMLPGTGTRTRLFLPCPGISFDLLPAWPSQTSPSSPTTFSPPTRGPALSAPLSAQGSGPRDALSPGFAFQGPCCWCPQAGCATPASALPRQRGRS